MTVKELSLKDGFRAVVLPDGDRPIHGAYCGDLLSWVMGRAKADNAWITIMTNINIVAVASLSDVACILLSEGVEPDAQVKETANARGINIVGTDLTSYEAAAALSRLEL